ncbi:MAG: hypothetical protein QOJ67_4175 [Acidimicrobiaceae bacterium]|jgi:O-antigen/teichoic acid export membrane protein
MADIESAHLDMTSLTSEAIGDAMGRRARGGVVQRSVSQTVGLTAGRALAAVVSFAWMAVIARSLGTDDVGALSLGLSLAVALSVIPDLGLPMIVTNRVAQHPEDTRSLVRHVISIRLRVSLAAGVMLVVMYRLGTTENLAVPLFMTLSIAATTVHSTATAALRGLATVVPDSVNEIVSRLFVLSLGWWLLESGHGIAAAAGTLAAADVLSAVALMRVLWRRSARGTAFPPGLIAWRTVVPLAAALLVGTLHARIDVWLLALIGSAGDVAHYAVPARIAEGLLLPAGVASALVLPLTAGVADARARGRLALRYVGVVTAVVALAGVVAAVWAGPLLEYAFGNPYGRDRDVLRLLCAAAVPTAVCIGLAPIVAILARRALVRWVLVAFIVNVAVNLALLPGYRGIGAAWASLASMSVVAAGLALTVVRLQPADPGATP